MKMPVAVVVVLIALAVGGGYWYSSSTYSPMPAVSSQTSTQQGDGTPISENLILGLDISSTLGQYLSAYNGMTLYTSNADTVGVSNCTGACAAAWPPYTVASTSDINISAATTGTVGTITRADGTLQITYNGIPLYFWKNDTNPGDTKGQGVGGFVVAKP